MYVVVRGITIWALYALASCVPVACQSSADDGALKWQLLYDPVPDEPFERLINQLNKRYTGMNNQLDQQRTVAIPMSRKRFQASSISGTPCNCTKVPSLTDLGPGHFPRILKEVECHEFDHCWKFVYPINILTNQHHKYNADSYNTEIELPTKLNNYRFVKINVTIACSCGPLT